MDSQTVELVRIGLDILALGVGLLVTHNVTNLNRQARSLAVDCAESMKVLATVINNQAEGLQVSNALAAETYDVAKTIEAEVCDVDVPISYLEVSDSGEN